MLEDYRKARRQGLKEVRRDIAAGHSPYPPALDTILAHAGRGADIPLGTMEIDLDLIAGTKTTARRTSFSRSFMPTQDEGSEFAAKWSALIDHQRADGITDPIEVFEFMQRFYVQEGNKRVSVARFLGASAIAADVTRIMPASSDDPAVRAYRAFTRFFDVAPIYGIALSDGASYAKLAALTGNDLEHRWSDESVQALRGSYRAFADAIARRAPEDLGITTGDAFLVYLESYGADALAPHAPSRIDEMLARAWSEIALAAGRAATAYLEEPQPEPTRHKLDLTPVLRPTARAKPFRMAFVYDRGPETSGWDALHEAGRRELELRLGAAIETTAFIDRAGDAAFDDAVAAAVADASDVVVTVSPKQLRQTLRAALAHPGIEFLNCSVNLARSAVRTFGVRLYEAKYLMGVLAAIMSDGPCIGYVAKTPVFATVAEVNAFARGVASVNPRAKVHLVWAATRHADWRRELARAGVSVAYGRDYPHPLADSEPWGLFLLGGDGRAVRIAEPRWEWGRYYELLVRSLQAGSGQRGRAQALGYWWGMSSGVVDVRLTDVVPEDPRRLIALLRRDIVDGRLDPFAGELRSQTGTVYAVDGRLAAEDIMGMDWLNENIVGRLPDAAELSSDGVDEVRASGLIPLDDPLAVKPLVPGGLI